MNDEIFRKCILLLLITCLSLLVAGCGVYSFTGTNLSPDIKTFTVLNFNTCLLYTSRCV